MAYVSFQFPISQLIPALPAILPQVGRIFTHFTLSPNLCLMPGILAGLPIIVFLILMVLNPTYEARLFAPGPTLCIPIGAALSMLAGFLVIRRVIALEV